MRFFRLNQKLNWKYILGELLLLFISINLAVWFNNWYSHRETTADKQIALSKITEEIKHNQLEMDTVILNNNHVLGAYNSYKKIYHGNTAELKTSPKYLDSLKKRYPKFFIVEDSTARENGLYQYTGTTFINLEIPTLTEIAWKTTSTLNVTGEFDYNCLYELESMYNLQRKVQNEINKSGDALQKRNLDQLMFILEFLEQMGNELMEDYEETLKEIQNCQ